MMILRRMLEPMFAQQRESKEQPKKVLYQMTLKEKMALKEAQKVVRAFSTKVEKSFKYGQGSLES